MTTDETTSHSAMPPKNGGQAAGYSHLTDKTTSHSADETPSHSTRLSKNDNRVAGYKLPKNGNQVAGYAALRKKFRAGIYIICGAAKFFPRLADDSARAAFARSGSASPCGVFGRTLNF
jgi:hypothetical protein